MKLDQYKLELPGDYVEILAVNDADAVVKAKAYLADHGIRCAGLKLFRYPKEWVNELRGHMIEVPFYQLTSKP